MFLFTNAMSNKKAPSGAVFIKLAEYFEVLSRGVYYSAVLLAFFTTGLVELAFPKPTDVLIPRPRSLLAILFASRRASCKPFIAALSSFCAATRVSRFDLAILAFPESAANAATFDLTDTAANFAALILSVTFFNDALSSACSVAGASRDLYLELGC